MKSAWLVAVAALVAASPAAGGCMTTPAGRTVCRNAAGQIVAAPVNGGAVAAGAVAPRTYPGGVSTVQGAYGGRAAYNARTGTATAAYTNARGVTTTQNSRGGEAKTMNGKGVVHTAGGTTCVKGAGRGKCN
jgi:hypothetical protein